MRNFRPLTRREKIIALVASGVVIIYLATGIVYKPLLREAAKREQDIRAQLKILKKNSRILEQAKRVHQKDQAFLSPFLQHNSDEEELSRLLSQLETLANKTQLRIAEMKPQKVRDKDSCKIFSVTLSLEGATLNIIRFLHGVQSPPLELGIDEIFIESKVLQQKIVTCRIDLSRFLLPKNNP